MADEGKQWGATEVMLTIIGVLGGVALGAWIFYVAVKMKSGAAATPDLSAKIAQIRAYIRTANQADSAMVGLTNAASAQALLDDAESTYGAALAQACDVNKLRRLIQKVQDRHGKTLGPVAA